MREPASGCRVGTPRPAFTQANLPASDGPRVRGKRESLERGGTAAQDGRRDVERQVRAEVVTGSLGPICISGVAGVLLKRPRGPFNGPRGLFKGPRGSFKGPRGPFKGPRPP